MNKHAGSERNLTLVMDLYELTMAYNYFKQGNKDQLVYFDMFYRKNPDNGGFAVFAGLQQLIEWLDRYEGMPTVRMIAKCRDMIAVEKEQIANAFRAGQIEMANDLLEDFNRLHGTNHKMPTNDSDDWVKYYNETYTPPPVADSTTEAP